MLSDAELDLLTTIVNRLLVAEDNRAGEGGPTDGFLELTAAMQRVIQERRLVEGLSNRGGGALPPRPRQVGG